MDNIEIRRLDCICDYCLSSDIVVNTHYAYDGRIEIKVKCKKCSKWKYIERKGERENGKGQRLEEGRGL